MKKIIYILSILLVLNSSFAEEAPFVLNPQTLKDQLLSNNISLLQALNNVQRAKVNLNAARAKMLPSINLTMLIPALSNPTFLLASVTTLFPFLVPSNWATLRQEKLLFEADKTSYRVIQLNTYSNALTLYYTYLTDNAVQVTFQNQVHALEQIYSTLKRQSDVLGNVTIEELEMSKAQLNDAKVKVSKLEELLIEEKASLRTMLDLPLGTELKVENADVDPSTMEEKTPAEVAEASLKISPENLQLDFLIKAATAGKYSKILGVFNSASLSTQSTGDGAVTDFGDVKASGGFNIGLDYLYNIKLNKNTINSIVLRKEELRNENEKLAEVLGSKIAEVREQKKLIESVLASRVVVVNAQLKQYQLGLLTLQTYLQSESQLTDSVVNKYKIDLDLKLQRLTLKRLMIEDEFETIVGCKEVTLKKSILDILRRPVDLGKVCKN